MPDAVAKRPKIVIPKADVDKLFKMLEESKVQ